MRDTTYKGHKVDYMLIEVSTEMAVIKTLSILPWG